MHSEVIGAIVADLDDLWEYGQHLDRDLKALCKMRLPQHRDEMQKIIVGLDVEQFDYAKDCIERLHNNLPKLDRVLFHEGKSPTRRRRANPSKGAPRA